MALSVSEKNPKVRVGGSGFTVFQWNSSIIGWARTVGHQTPQPVAPPSAIQPLDSRYPLQIITPAAIGAGTLNVAYFEKYNQKIWDEIMTTVSGGSTTKFNDLVQVFIQLAAQNNPITCMKVVAPPVLRGAQPRTYADVYHNCVITNIDDSENIEIGTMEIVKSMTISYTYMTRYGKDYGSSSAPFNISSALPAIGVSDPNFQ
jgi:hypothetical protein